jgi:hypothetical protein
MVVRDGRSIDLEAGLEKGSHTRNEDHPDHDLRNLQADTEVDQSNFAFILLEKFVQSTKQYPNKVIIRIPD